MPEVVVVAVVGDEAVPDTHSVAKEFASPVNDVYSIVESGENAAMNLKNLMTSVRPE